MLSGDHLLALLSCQTATFLTEPKNCLTHWPRPECPLCSKWVSGMTDCTEVEAALVFDLVPYDDKFGVHLLFLPRYQI